MDCTSRLNIYLKFNLSVINVEQLMIEMSPAENLVEMVAIGVGDENLTKSGTGNQLHDFLHTGGIELVEDVIEQK